MLEKILNELYNFILEKQVKSGNYIALYNDGELVDTIKR
jgi:hypothetical protein